MHSRTHPRRGPARRRRVREAGVADELIAAANPGCQMEKTFLLTSRAQHARLVTRQSSSPRARGRRSCASSADHGPSRRLTHAGTRNSACPETSPVRGSNKQVRPYVCINFVKKSTAVCVQVVRWVDAHRGPAAALYIRQLCAATSGQVSRWLRLRRCLRSKSGVGVRPGRAADIFY